MDRFNGIYLDIQDVAWKRCEEELGLQQGTFADDLARRDLGDDTRLINLTLLKVFEEMRRALEVSEFRAETDALRAGSTYAEIASRKGVSRQAVRQRRKRHVQSLREQERTVTLVGGPYNGDRITVSEAAKAARTPVSVYRQYADDSYEDRTWAARYVQSTDHEAEFVFVSIVEWAKLDDPK